MIQILNLHCCKLKIRLKFHSNRISYRVSYRALNLIKIIFVRNLLSGSVVGYIGLSRNDLDCVAHKCLPDLIIMDPRKHFAKYAGFAYTTEYDTDLGAAFRNL